VERQTLSKEFDNTFVPHVKRDRLTVSQIIAGLKAHVFTLDSFPAEVRNAVQEELDRRTESD